MAQPGDGGLGDWPVERDLPWKATLLRGRPSQKHHGVNADRGDGVASAATGPSSSPPGPVGSKEGASSTRGASGPRVRLRERRAQSGSDRTLGLCLVTPTRRGRPKPKVRTAPAHQGPAATGGPTLQHLLCGHATSLQDTPNRSPDAESGHSDSH